MREPCGYTVFVHFRFPLFQGIHYDRGLGSSHFYIHFDLEFSLPTYCFSLLSSNNGDLTSFNQHIWGYHGDFVDHFGWCQVNGRRLQELEAIELQHLDRVVLGRSVSLGCGYSWRWSSIESIHFHRA